MSTSDVPHSKPDSAVLLISCPDRPGIMAETFTFLARHNGNVLQADNFGDPDQNVFLMRVEWDLLHFEIDMRDFSAHFARLAERFQMHWRVALSSYRPRMAVMASRQDHCLADLLHRHQIGELACEVPLVVSNHPDAQRLAEFYGVEFHHVPMEKEHKPEAEATILELLRAHNIDFIVLARFMQVLSNEFIEHYPNRIINIHHSFLPAFVGAKPYHRAFERGVKLVGATAHYVTEVLDEGPIIEQDTARVSHRDTLDVLLQKGRDLEKVVLSRAVRWHVENRILLYGNKTTVFD
jgi:formyltetrahydrofolate deformylase